MGIRDWFKPKPSKPNLKVEWETPEGFAEAEFLFIRVSEADVKSALGAWRWLPLNGLTVFAVSAFGEVFLRHDTGRILYIDTIEGQLSDVANNMSEFTRMLSGDEMRDKVLLRGFVMSARTKGLCLDDGECYDFKIAPILGGPMDIDHVEKTSFIVKLDIAGQIHEQVKDLPPGTEISEIQIKD